MLEHNENYQENKTIINQESPLTDYGLENKPDCNGILLHQTPMHKPIPYHEFNAQQLR